MNSSLRLGESAYTGYQCNALFAGERSRFDCNGDSLPLRNSHIDNAPQLGESIQWRMITSPRHDFC